MRLLIVDDDDAFRALLRTTFEVVDVEVEEASSAEAALSIVELRRPDAIVLDVSMPGMGGLELCRRVKADPATQAVAIVLLSGSVSDLAVAGESDAADAYLRKPFSPLELLDVVERLTGSVEAVPPPISGERRGRRAAAPALRARPPPPAGDRARPARAAPERLPGDRRRARERARVQGHGHARPLPARPALRARAGPRGQPGPDRRPERRVRLPPPRRRQDRDPRPHPPEARAAERGRDPAHANAHAPRRADARRRGLPPRRGAPHRALAPRALGRQRLSGRDRGHRHPARGAHLRRRRRARRHDERPALPLGALLGRRPARKSLAQSAAQFDPGVVRAFVEREDALRLVRSELAA